MSDELGNEFPKEGNLQNASANRISRRASAIPGNQRRERGVARRWHKEQFAEVPLWTMSNRRAIAALRNYSRRELGTEGSDPLSGVKGAILSLERSERYSLSEPFVAFYYYSCILYTTTITVLQVLP